GALGRRAPPAWYLSGSSFSGRQYISYKGDAAPIEAQTSPSIVYHSLFDGFTPTDATARAQHDFDLRARQSVLSLITDKRTRLLGTVGATDRNQLHRHFDQIRDLQPRAAPPPPPPGGWGQLPKEPGPDLPVGGNNGGSGSDTIATNTGYSDEATRARLMAD